MIIAIAALLLLGVAAWFVVTYERGAPGDDEGAAPVSTFPPGTITPADDETEETDCGEYTWPIESQLDDTTEDQFQDEHDCITEALGAGAPAVLVEHTFTVEGDPIRTQLRVVGPGQFDLTYDTTLDGFGSQTVYTVRCTALAITDSRLDPVDCSPPPD